MAAGGGWGKLIQTTRCPRSLSPSSSSFRSPFLSVEKKGASALLSLPLSRLPFAVTRPPPAYRDWRKAKVFEVISPSYLADQNAERYGINLESTSIPSNVTRPNTSLISVRLAN